MVTKMVNKILWAISWGILAAVQATLALIFYCKGNWINGVAETLLFICSTVGVAYYGAAALKNAKEIDRKIETK